MSEQPLTYQDLAKRWTCSERHARRVCRMINLVPVDLGYRTKRFRPAAVDAAEARSETLKKKGGRS